MKVPAGPFFLQNKMKKMKLISWNVNGLRAVVKHDFIKSVEAMNPDVLALQEIKIQEKQLPEEVKQLNYNKNWSFGLRAGYSGVATFSKEKPLSVKYGIGIKKFDDEGRILITEHRVGSVKFFLYNIYFPNGKMSDERLKYKLDFYEALLKFIHDRRLEGDKIIICGDLNTAHREIDLKNPKSNEKHSGFLPIEREWIDKYLSEGFVDSFRFIHGDEVKYSWWSYRFNARAKNVGWRIDYFLVDERLKKYLKDAFILNEIKGSDHCPVGITLEG